MCLAMCLKNQEFQPDCVYKICVYKKKMCIQATYFLVVQDNIPWVPNTKMFLKSKFSKRYFTMYDLV